MKKGSVVIIILALLLCFFAFSKCDSSNREIDAWVCAKHIVEQDLKSPSTAVFCSYPDAKIVNTGGDDYTIKGYVDAENSFGAKIRTYFTVRLTLTKSGYTNGRAQYD